MERDDDPTRALDDFVSRLASATPSPEPPDLDDLLGRIQPSRAGTTPARGGVLRNGGRWSAADVVDVPSIDLPSMEPPTHAIEPPRLDLPPMELAHPGTPPVRLPEVEDMTLPSPSMLQATMAEASRLASAGFAGDAHAAARPWQPDIDAVLERRARDPRLLSAWQPGCWVAAVREVFEATTEFVVTPEGPVVETYAPHRLLVAWAPQGLDRPLLGRWPTQVRLSAVPRDAAAAVLLAQLPDDALLWSGAQAEDVDWALAAEIVLHHDPALRPFQVEALRRFVDAEREAAFARVNDRYLQPTPGAAVARRADA